MTDKTPDNFWLNDPMVLIRGNNYYKLVPNGQMTKIERLNALTRLFILLAIIFIIFSLDIKYILIPIIGIVLMIIWYQILIKNTKENFNPEDDFESEERFDQIDQIDQTDETNQSTNLSLKSCQLPTRDNPFMNVTMADLMNNPSRLPAADIQNDEIKKQINDYFNDDIYLNKESLANTSYAQRAFYTMPSTTIPNDQTEFAKWLYQTKETCKENNLNCQIYEDLRIKRGS